MNSVNGVNTTSVNQINPAEMSQQDFIAAVYLERGEMLDTEVRRLVTEMDKSNQMASAINTLLGKTNLSQYGTAGYTQPTWTVNGNTVALDNGYGLTFSPDDDGETTFTLMDADGNQLIYQNQTLVPVPEGTTVDVVKAGIPVMSDMTFVLDDRTKITFQAGTPETPFDGQNFSGGLAGITQVVISRDNQSLLVSGIDTSIPSIGMPSVEVDADVTVQESVTKPARTLNGFRDVFAGVKLSDVIGNYAAGVYGQLAEDISAMSEAEQQALFDQLKSNGFSMNWSSFEAFQAVVPPQNTVVDELNPTHSQEQSYTVQEGETLLGFLNRAITDSATNHTSYYNSYLENRDFVLNGASIRRRLEYLDVTFNMPSYSYTESVRIPAWKTLSEPELESVAAQQVPWEKQSFSLASDHDYIKRDRVDYMMSKMGQMLSEMTDEQQNGLLEELKTSDVSISWNIAGMFRSYSYRPKAGETLKEFTTRMINESAENVFDVVGWRFGPKEALTSVQPFMTFPAYIYDNRADSLSNVTDALFNDGYILTESGGVHDWEYAGGSVSNITVTNPGGDGETVSGFFARKQAFEADLNNEFYVRTPFLTQKEIDLLTNELRITYSDASGTGNLTPKEWSSLKSSLVTARDNLTSNTQLQTARLQRAMESYTKNYDAMSNLQSKIYNLLRDIIGNMK